MSTQKIIIWTLIGILFNLFYIALSSLRYKYMLGYFKHKISIMRASFLFCISQTIGYFDPSNIGGILGKAIASQKMYHVDARASLSITLFEQAFDVIWQVVFLAVMVLLFGKVLFPDVPYFAMITVLIAAVICILITLYFNKIIKILITKLIPKRLAKTSYFKEENLYGLKSELIHYFKKPRFLIGIFLFTLIAALFSPFLIIISLMPFGVMITYSQAFLVYWISFIIGRLSGIPGGFVSRDAMMLGLLLHYGVESSMIWKSIVVYRAITLVPNLAIGGGLLIYYGLKYGINVFSKPSDNT